MKIKSQILAFTAISALAAGSSQAALLISGIVDGTQTGGIPKGLEIYTDSTVADLSAFWIARDTNGAGPWDTFFQLPSVSLSADSYYYIAGNTDSETILNGFGFSVGVVNSILNINGDDIIGLATSGNAVDVYDSIGVVAQGDTNFYENSFAIRDNASVTGNIAATDGSNFTITAYTDAGLQGSTGFGTYAPVPEPSTALLGALGVLALLRRRR